MEYPHYFNCKIRATLDAKHAFNAFVFINYFGMPLGIGRENITGAKRNANAAAIAPFMINGDFDGFFLSGS
jgi:hypothetical protein